MNEMKALFVPNQYIYFLFLKWTKTCILISNFYIPFGLFLYFVVLRTQHWLNSSSSFFLSKPYFTFSQSSLFLPLSAPPSAARRNLHAVVEAPVVSAFPRSRSRHLPLILSWLSPIRLISVHFCPEHCGSAPKPRRLWDRATAACFSDPKVLFSVFVLFFWVMLVVYSLSLTENKITNNFLLLLLMMMISFPIDVLLT